MTEHAEHSIVVDAPLEEVWALLRDFNSYPVWVDGVITSRILGDLPGSTVGAVREFVVAGRRRQQRLVALSDVEHWFTYENVDLGEDEAPSMDWYRGTVRVLPVDATNGSLVEYSVDYGCPTEDADHWRAWWASSLPAWLASLGRHFSSRQHA
jgi:hypothetical protein